MSTGFTATDLIAFLLVLVRVGAWLWITPPFGGKTVPARIRVSLSMALAVPMTPPAVAAVAEMPMTPGAIAGAAVMQVAIGAALGLVSLMLISAVQSAGALIDLFGGFTLAQGFDPLLMQQSSVMSRVYQMTAGVLMLVTGAHLVLIQGFAATFEALPLDGALPLEATATTLTTSLTTMFVSALQIAGPLIGVMVLADLGLGLMSRVAPALNAFSLGFALKIGLTLSLMALAIPMLPPAVIGLSNEAVEAMSAITGGG